MSSFASASWVPQQTHNVSLLETRHASQSGRDEPGYLELRTFRCDTDRNRLSLRHKATDSHVHCMFQLRQTLLSNPRILRG
jgi:hypothetical protein